MLIPESRPEFAGRLTAAVKLQQGSFVSSGESPNSPQAHVLLSLDCLNNTCILGSSGGLRGEDLQDEGGLE